MWNEADYAYQNPMRNSLSAIDDIICKDIHRGYISQITTQPNPWCPHPQSGGGGGRGGGGISIFHGDRQQMCGGNNSIFSFGGGGGGGCLWGERGDDTMHISHLCCSSIQCGDKAVRR